MRNILLILLTLISFNSFSQLTTFNPDTVCFQTNGSLYTVNNVPGLTYTWIVQAPGVITSGQGTNQITVNWSTAPVGLINNAVSVSATNAAGCQSPVVNLNVFIYDIVVTATALNPLCETSPCVNLVAGPLGGVWTGTGVSGNQFCPGTSGPGQFNLTYTITSGGCIFTDVITVSVSPEPTLLPIQHN